MACVLRSPMKMNFKQSCCKSVVVVVEVVVVVVVVVVEVVEVVDDVEVVVEVVSILEINLSTIHDDCTLLSLSLSKHPDP